MIGAVRGFARFWYDFLVGDDWRVALGVVAALTITVVTSRAGGVDPWWIVATIVAVLLPLSVRRAARADLQRRFSVISLRSAHDEDGPGVAPPPT